MKPDQTQEDDIYSNNEGSAYYHQFLDMLGTKVKLDGFAGFKGGLDCKSGEDTTGTHSYHTQLWFNLNGEVSLMGNDNNLNCAEIMFHVSTLLPYTTESTQQLQRKRFQN